MNLLKIKLLVFAMIGVLFSNVTHSQSNDLVLKAEELVYSNPDEAIKIAEHVLNTSQIPQEIAVANSLLSRGYLVKGDYNNALIYAFDNNNQLEDISLEVRVQNQILKATLLRKLFLDSQSQSCLNEAESLLTQSSIEKDILEYKIFVERTQMLIDRLNTNAAIEAIKDSELKFKPFLEKNKVEKRAYFLLKEQAFNGSSQLDSAFVYSNKTLDLSDDPKSINLYEKAIIYRDLGHLYLQNKAFKKSEETLFIALRFAEIIDNPFLLEQINRELAINFLASNQRSKHVIYNEEFLVLNNQTEAIELESVNTIYNILSEKNETIKSQQETTHKNYIYIFLVVVLLIIIIGVMILLKSESQKKRFNEIINYLEVSRNIFMKIKPSKKPISKRVAITEETERTILQKLKRFENSKKFINKDMSLAVLAGQFETNTKYLSEIINKHYNDNFNTFINKLRINYIIDKLKNDTNYINYKISFLAEESGFSSHSSFATVFKSIVGMSPVTFIDLLKNEREELKNKKEL